MTTKLYEKTLSDGSRVHDVRVTLDDGVKVAIYATSYREALRISLALEDCGSGEVVEIPVGLDTKELRTI